MSTNHTAGQVVFFGISDTGLQRDNNEDHFIVADLTRQLIGVHDNTVDIDLTSHDIGERGTLVAVADGLGGHEGGEIASQVAVDVTVKALFKVMSQPLSLAEQLKSSVVTAHGAIARYHGEGGGARRMASTLTAIHVGEEKLTIAQVGDSRAYRFSAGKLTELTEDQTVVQMMLKKGMLTEEEAQHHPHRNVILQALGQGRAVTPVVQTLSWYDGDRLLLCSDGLSSYVSHEAIEEILAAGQDEKTSCRRLVAAANAAGGADNVTVLLVRLHAKDSGEGGRVRGDAETSLDGQTDDSPGLLSMATESVELSMSWLQKIAGGQVGSEEEAEKFERELEGRSSRLGFWKQQIAGFLGNKAQKHPEDGAVEASAAQQAYEPSQSGNAPRRRFSFFGLFKSKKAPVASLWDPRVLRTLEESLKDYVGPAAKVMVHRAAGQTNDMEELRLLLAQQITNEQERRNFLRTVGSL